MLKPHSTEPQYDMQSPSHTCIVHRTCNQQPVDTFNHHHVHRCSCQAYTPRKRTKQNTWAHSAMHPSNQTLQIRYKLHLYSSSQHSLAQILPLRRTKYQQVPAMSGVHNNARAPSTAAVHCRQCRRWLAYPARARDTPRGGSNPASIMKRGAFVLPVHAQQHTSTGTGIYAPQHQPLSTV